MIEALRALQSKIARLEMERASAAEKFESLSSRTSQKQLDLFDRPVVTENILEAPKIQPVSGSELRNISYTSVAQVTICKCSRTSISGNGSVLNNIIHVNIW